MYFFSGSNNTDGGILLDKFRHLCFMIYIAFGLLKYNINVIQFTSSQCHGTEHYEDKCVNNEKCMQLFQNSMDEDVQSCTMQDIYKPDLIILESNSILGRASMIDWLRSVQSDSNTGGACSSSALEILRRREKIRYVFQHYPTYFIDVSYILSSLYVNIVS